MRTQTSNDSKTPTVSRRDRPGRQRRALGFLVDAMLGLVLGALTCRALDGLPSFYGELQRLGIVEQPPLSTAGLHLGIAALVAVLYAIHPLLGGGMALLSLVLPVALLNVGLAGVFAILAVLSLPCLAKRGGALLIALIPLALAYPGLALLLPLIPVLAGLLYGRVLGPYVAGFAALVLIVLGLVAGQAAVGGVYVSGDQDPLMASEAMMLIATKAPLLPPPIFDDPQLAEVLRRNLREHDFAALGTFAYLMLQWTLSAFPLALILALVELAPRVVTPPLIAQVALWAAVGGAVSWLTWLVTKKRATWSTIGAAVAAVVGTVVTVAGHLVIPRFFGVASTLPSASRALATAVASGGVAVALWTWSGGTARRGRQPDRWGWGSG